MAKKARKDHSSQNERHGANPQSAKKNVRSSTTRKNAGGRKSKARVSTESPGGGEDSQFARDRRRFLYLCRTIKSRVEQETSPDSVGAIGGLLREFEETGLAQRLGFGAPPLVWTDRPEPRDRLINLLIWNGPHGEGGGELLLSTSLTIKGKRERMLNITMSPDQSENRQLIASLLQEWIQAIDGLEEPDAYPAMPPGIVLGVNPRLCADQFWMNLRLLRRMIDNDMGAAFVAAWPCPEYWRQRMLDNLVRRIGRAAWGCASSDGVVCVRLGGHLRVFHPAGLGTVDIDVKWITSPPARAPEECEKAVGYLEEWLSIREQEVVVGPMRDALSDLDLDILEAMVELGATHKDRHATAADVAGKALADPDPARVKDRIAMLGKKGLVRSLRGRTGGSWITPAGRRRLALARER